MKPSRPAIYSWIVALLLVALIAASCGSDAEEVEAAETDATESTESTESTEATESTESTEDTEDAESTEGDVPTSIVSLSPTATEILYAIGAGEQVAAVDLYSNYPPEAPDGTLDAFVPDLEAILASEPDLVVTSFLAEDIMAGLEAAGIGVITQPAAASLDEVYNQITELGAATGQIDGATNVNEELQAAIEDVLASLPERDTPLSVFHEIDETFYTATSATFIGQIYDSMGFVNIADEYDDGTGYPVVDGETIIAANPDIIVFTSQAPYDVAAIAARPGWDAVGAVANDRVVQVDADIASRWGPRIVEFMTALSEVAQG